MIPTDYKTLCEFLSQNPHIEVKHYCSEANCHLVFKSADESRITFKTKTGATISFVPQFAADKVTYEKDGVYYHLPFGKMIRYIYSKPREAVVTKVP